MGFKSSSAALFLSLNLLFFACALASEYGSSYNTPNIPDVPTPYHPKPTPSPANLVPHFPKPTLTPVNPALSNSVPSPTPSLSNSVPSPTPSLSKCSRDTLKLGACAKLLNGPINVVIGHGTSRPCCALINGLVDTQVGVCLCTALKANVIGIKLDINVALSVLVNTCGKKIPRGFKCV